MWDSYDVTVFTSAGIYSSMEGGKHMMKWMINLRRFLGKMLNVLPDYLPLL